MNDDRVSWGWMRKNKDLSIVRTTKTANVMEWSGSAHEPAWNLIWVLTRVTASENKMININHKYDEVITDSFGIDIVVGMTSRNASI